MPHCLIMNCLGFSFHPCPLIFTEDPLHSGCPLPCGYYQLPAGGARIKYFQRVKWQYMVLDEAQAPLKAQGRNKVCGLRTYGYMDMCMTHEHKNEGQREFKTYLRKPCI